jgi:glycosyltransferase involved in cell wall biosynthesis
MARICIVTPGHLGSNPRVVKEVEALLTAGHEVTVIHGEFSDWGRLSDLAIAKRLDAIGAVRFVAVAFGPRQGSIAHYLRQTIVRRSARMLVAVGINSAAVVTAAHHPAARDLTRAASRVSADVYIAHYVAALPAAAQASEKNDARFAFDAEDFHLGDLSDIPAHALENRLISAIERRYLPHAVYVTAASPGIARAYAETYQIAMPTIILNVFPLAQSSPSATLAGIVSPRPSLYWFSQTIGPGRGLELAISAIAAARSKPHLHLRGTPSDSYRERLTVLADELGVPDRVHFLPRISPDQLERDGSNYDLGLVAETADTYNRQIALTNKLFSYLTSGIAIVASDIAAHRAIAEDLSDAITLFKQGDVTSLAQAIDRVLLDPKQLAAARTRSWLLAQTRYNWDTEQEKLLQLVTKCAAA